MKTIAKIYFLFLIIVIAILMLGVISANAATLNLKASWTANTEADMAGYNLYRTDGVRTKVNSTLIPIPAVLYNFSLTLPDNSSGTLTFVLTAVDTNNNESLDSLTASYNYNLDAIPPARPGGFGVVKQ